MLFVFAPFDANQKLHRCRNFSDTQHLKPINPLNSMLFYTASSDPRQLFYFLVPAAILTSAAYFALS